MKKLIIGFTLLIFILGCTYTMTEDELPQSKLPDMKQVEEAEEKPLPKTEVSVKPEEKTPPPVEKEVDGTIGNPLTGKTEDIQEETVPKGEITVTFTKDMVYDQKALTIKSGDTVFFKNADEGPHLVLVDRVYNRDRLVRGDRQSAGEVWSNTFTETGTFYVHDMWSGSAQLTLTVE